MAYTADSEGEVWFSVVIVQTNICSEKAAKKPFSVCRFIIFISIAIDPKNNTDFHVNLLFDSNVSLVCVNCCTLSWLIDITIHIHQILYTLYAAINKSFNFIWLEFFT